jgi:tRNA A37 methylthiotransferase MiaB
MELEHLKKHKVTGNECVQVDKCYLRNRNMSLQRSFIVSFAGEHQESFKRRVRMRHYFYFFLLKQPVARPHYF